MFAIFFVHLFFIVIQGTEEDLFADLWKKFKPMKPLKMAKNYERSGIKRENWIKQSIHNFDKSLLTTSLKAEDVSSDHQKQEDIKPKILGEIKKEAFSDEEQNAMIVSTKVKVPKKEIYDEVISDGIDEKQASDQTNSCSSKAYDSDHSSDSNVKSSEEYDEELEFIKKYNLMKKELRQKNIYKNLSFYNFEKEIAKKLGKSLDKIYETKRKLRKSKKLIDEKEEINEDTKRELVQKFEEMRKEKIYGFKLENKNISKIEREIAKDLGISRKNIYGWKKDFGVVRKFSNQRKIEIIEKFEKCREELEKQFNLKTTQKIEAKIAEKFGVRVRTIYDWGRKLGQFIPKQKKYTKTEKLESVEKFDRMKKRNPNLSGAQIAKKLEIRMRNVRRWRKQFGTDGM